MTGAIQLPYKTPWFTFSLESAAACLAMRGHPTAYHAVLNQCVTLSCAKRFLDGCAGTHTGIPHARIGDFSCLEQYTVSFRFGLPYCREIIRELLHKGFYIYCNGVDGYDLPGMSGYGLRHGHNDGILCGYDDNDGTYSIAAYDSTRCFRQIWLPQECFEEGLRSCLAHGAYSTMTACRMRDLRVRLNEGQMLRYLSLYLEADTDVFSPLQSERSTVEGIAVQELLALYFGRLACGEIPLSRADRQALRAVWEHRKCMLDRLELLERRHGWGSAFSSRYRPLVDAAYRDRMLYAVSCRSRRPDLLEVLQGALRAEKAAERTILSDLLCTVEKDERDLGRCRNPQGAS
ncbi:MAG TPA: hypothetical protein DDW30_02575 [Clostridiales bacterium]|nr:hypothetical protein [Clostridiales bacterium]